MLNRKAYNQLHNWKTSKTRKPLLIRGARQVGKTTLVRQFSQEFAEYLELNLERETDRLFFKSDDINKILNAACLSKKVNPNKQPFLLFIDEIQESPKTIQLLRYFHEEKPNIYVIAAGSLLEFALRKVASFPVGRIDYLYLHPLNFFEFLQATGNKLAIQALAKIPLEEYAHSVLLKLFNEYAIIGGMPEIVNQYITSGYVAGLAPIYNRLWQAYKDDVEKYARNSTDAKIIRHVIAMAPYEQDRIKFEGFGNSNYRSREVGEALRSLDLAKIIRLIYPATSLKPPIVSDLKKRPRLQFLDTGLLNHILMLQTDILQLEDLSDFHKGHIIQHLVTQELISIFDDIAFMPNFWVREAKGTNSEVDLLFHYKKYIIPLEVKSGKTGKLRSLHQFMDRTNHPFAIRVYGGEFKIEKVKTQVGTEFKLMNLPYFLITQLKNYLDFFVANK